ncbi:MAG: lasso peptide biosynthesis PqqD family chaperone [Anaerolineae bacterium]|nr:lasso peptide biosynthesis PqqD family chaperone [Anaerolineae bacterium]
MVSLHSTIVVTKNQISSDLGEEVAILQLKKGMYYGLDPVGARIWDLIQEPKTVQKVCEVILDEYEVEPERCEHDILALLERLLTEELIEIKDEASPHLPEPVSN